MRSDKAKSIDKVAAHVTKNPLAGISEIADKEGLGVGTVHRALLELEKNGKKDPRIVNLTDGDLLIQELANEETIRRFKDPDELAKMRTTEIAQVAEKHHNRYVLLRGKATDEDGALPELKGLSDLDLIKLAGIQ